MDTLTAILIAVAAFIVGAAAAGFICFKMGIKLICLDCGAMSYKKICLIRFHSIFSCKHTGKQREITVFMK